MLKSFSYHYLITHYNMVKCHRNVDKFEEIDTAPKKKMGFDYYEKYLRSISNKVLLLECLIKTNSHSVDICRLIRNQ